jgi:ATP-dependent Clp protease protease subunit
MDYYWGIKNEILNNKDKEQPSISTINNDIFFYSNITNNSIFKLNEQIHGLQVKIKKDAIDRNSKEYDNINLHIKSYGGSLFAGIAGMDMILQSEIPIYTIIEGCCASAGTFLSIVGYKRFINKHAYIMIHQLRSAMWGKYEEFKDEIENLDNLMDLIRKIYKEYTNIPEAKINEILKHDLWFNAEKSYEYQLIDDIL